MNVLVTGATGFTGSFVVPRLLDKGFSVRCFVRRASSTKYLPESGIQLTYGDLGDVESLKRSLQGIDMLVNIASIGFGHAPVIVQACVERSIKRALFVSTTAIFTTLNAPTKSIRLAAEETIRKSGIAYTILRPTMIYGSSRDRNMSRLIRCLQRWPMLPIFGSGDNLQQPVHVTDVAEAVVNAVLSDKTIAKAYNIAGSAPLTYNQVLDTICSLLGRRVFKIHVPASPVVKSLGFSERLGLKSPIKAEQILRLNEDKAFDFKEAASDFRFSPLSFVEGVALELEEMGLRPLVSR